MPLRQRSNDEIALKVIETSDKLNIGLEKICISIYINQPPSHPHLRDEAVAVGAICCLERSARLKYASAGTQLLLFPGSSSSSSSRSAWVLKLKLPPPVETTLSFGYKAYCW